MSGVVVVVGEGFLAGHVSEKLADTYEVIHRTGFEDDIPLSADPDLVLVVHDTWRPSVHQQAEETYGWKAFPGYGDLLPSEKVWSVLSFVPADRDVPSVQICAVLWQGANGKKCPPLNRS
jgi:hypothetical protein